MINEIDLIDLILIIWKVDSFFYNFIIFLRFFIELKPNQITEIPFRFMTKQSIKFTIHL